MAVAQEGPWWETTMDCFVSCPLSLLNNRLSLISILIAMRQSCSNQIRHIPITPHGGGEKQKTAMLTPAWLEVDKESRYRFKRRFIICHKTRVLTTRGH